MDAERLIVMEEDDNLKTVVGDAPGGLGSIVGRYRPLGVSRQLMVLRRNVGRAAEETEDRILMAGELLFDNTVLEVVNMIFASRWTGALHVHGPTSHRTLGIERGALRFARSDDPEDRLNKVLFRLGVLSPSESEEVERWPKSDQRFGEAMLRKGLLSEKDLFRYLERQMAEIFYSAILEQEGCYLFNVGRGWSADASVTAHLPMQQMLFDAAERLDRWAEFERLVPDESLCPQARPGVEVTRLGPRERRVFGSCDGTKSVRELARESWLGRFGAMAVVYELVRGGCVDLQPPRRGLEETANALVAPFADALREITNAVGQNGELKRLHQELRRWVAESEFEQYLGPALTERLMVDPCQVASVLEGLRVRDRVEIVEHALHELVAFALFAASFSLPREQEEALQQRVQGRLGRFGGGGAG